MSVWFPADDPYAYGDIETADASPKCASGVRRAWQRLFELGGSLGSRTFGMGGRGDQNRRPSRPTEFPPAHANVAAAAPIIPVSRPSFLPGSPGYALHPPAHVADEKTNLDLPQATTPVA